LTEPETVLGVVGAEGRLGKAILAECTRLGVRVGVTASRAGWRTEETARVLVDASGPSALDDTIGYCERTGAALIYTVSSVSTEARERLVALSARTPVVLADNLSIGHWLQVQLIQAVASLTSSLADPPRMSVLERHPVTKLDRPSASAKSLAAAWGEAAVPAAGEIVAQRAGQPVSDHVVTFDLPGVSLSIGHSVSDLRAAATGLLGVIGYVGRRFEGFSTIFEVYSRVYGRGSDHNGR
jgi:4-hydroxy-tetrahydrodipicolinate reductase